MVGPLLIAVADCEARIGTFFEQPVNAWSSFAYVIAGAVIAARARQARSQAMSRTGTGFAGTGFTGGGAFTAFGVIVAIEGIGSVLFHGTSWQIGSFLHDVALVGLVGAVAGWHLGRATCATASRTSASRNAGTAPTSGATAFMRSWPPWLAGRARCDAQVGLWLGLQYGVVVGVVTWALPSAATNVAVGAGIVVVGAAELRTRRRGTAGVWNAPLLVLTSGAVAVWMLGTSGSPACRDDSLLQFHAAWHVASALMLIAWARQAALIEAGDRWAPEPDASPTHT